MDPKILMQKIDQIDPVREGVFVPKSLEIVHEEEDMIILRGNIGLGVDVFFTHYRDGNIGQMVVRATGEVYQKAKKALENND